jgi:arylesterase / paraoxonase
VTKKLGIVALIVGFAIVAVAAEFLRRSGAFIRVTPHFDGKCTAIQMSASAEDISIDHGTGLAYLSYLDRGEVLAGKKAPGTIMLVDLRAKEPRVRAALSSEPADFQPYGMSLYAPLRGTRKLFVISHPAAQEPRVEIFEQTRGSPFAPVKTISHSLLKAPIAIVAVGPRQFYVLNDSSGGTLFERLQIGLGFKDAPSSLLYYDGQTMRIVAQGLKSPSGLAGNRERRSLYVGEAVAKQVRVYAVDSATGFLKLREIIALPSAPDNITVSESGDLYIASHPKLLAQARMLDDPQNVRSPTQVLRLSPNAPDEDRVTEVFADDGERFSAGSVAAAHEDRLLIGSLIEKKILDCRRTPAKTSGPGD